MPHACKCFAFTLPMSIMVWIFAGYKTWEGRTTSSVLAKLSIPCASCSVCLFAGARGTLWCRLEEVVEVHSPRELITTSNWRSFVPWETSFTRALDVYTSMSDGSGFVFMRLRLPPERFANIGTIPSH